jgi:GNAT superfamily N-acetyltransferase
MSDISQDKSPLVDTAESLRAKPRKPTHTKFYPVGHISLDDRNEKTGNFVLDLPKEGVYWIKTFYVSKALRSKGIGRAAMDIVESMATEEPLCAKTLALDTAEKEMQKKLYREKNGKELGVSLGRCECLQSTELTRFSQLTRIGMNGEDIG